MIIKDFIFVGNLFLKFFLLINPVFSSVLESLKRKKPEPSDTT